MAWHGLGLAHKALYALCAIAGEVKTLRGEQAGGRGDGEAVPTRSSDFLDVDEEKEIEHMGYPSEAQAVLLPPCHTGFVTCVAERLFALPSLTAG